MDFDMYRLLDRQDRTVGIDDIDSGLPSMPIASKIPASRSAEADVSRGGGVPVSPTPSETFDGDQYIKFDDTTASGPATERIFIATNEQKYSMAYTSAQDLSVNKATWRVANVTGFEEWTDISILTFGEGESKVEDLMTDIKNGIILAFSQFLAHDSLITKRGAEMVLVLDWTLGERNGNTTSRAFSVTNGSVHEQEEAIANLQDSAYGASQVSVVDPALIDDSERTPGVTQLTMLPLPSGNSSRGNLDGKPSDGGGGIGGGGGGGGGGSSGLSTGAIAGIAVGVGVLALIMLGAAIFFCIRRRRRRDADAHVAQQSKMSSYMVAGKETSPIALDSPSSPYQDDHFPPQQHHHQQQQQQQLHQVPRRVPVPASGAAGERRHSRNESDAARSPTPASSAETPQHGVSRHLVEEGMTMEEIRRLEEEERQLDDEIERAGRR